MRVRPLLVRLALGISTITAAGGSVKLMLSLFKHYNIDVTPDQALGYLVLALMSAAVSFGIGHIIVSIFPSLDRKQD